MSTICLQCQTIIIFILVQPIILTICVSTWIGLFGASFFIIWLVSVHWFNIGHLIFCFCSWMFFNWRCSDLKNSMIMRRLWYVDCGWIGDGIVAMWTPGWIPRFCPIWKGCWVWKCPDPCEIYLALINCWFRDVVTVGGTFQRQWDSTVVIFIDVQLRLSSTSSIDARSRLHCSAEVVRLVINIPCISINLFLCVILLNATYQCKKKIKFASYWSSTWAMGIAMLLTWFIHVFYVEWLNKPSGTYYLGAV